MFGESHVFIKHSSLSSVATTAPKGWLIRFKSSKFSGNAELTKHNYKGIIWAAVDKAMSAFFLLYSNPISISCIRNRKEEGVLFSETSRHCGTLGWVRGPETLQAVAISSRVTSDPAFYLSVFKIIIKKIQQLHIALKRQDMCLRAYHHAVP